jgi:predicted DNA-binding antitoxin AbrB/MazE fold protein
MKHTINAIYENGVFRPLKSPEISEGQQVRLMVETTSDPTPEELLELAAQVCQGLSAEQINDIEQIALTRRNFFAKKHNLTSHHYRNLNASKTASAHARSASRSSGTGS